MLSLLVPMVLVEAILLELTSASPADTGSTANLTSPVRVAAKTTTWTSACPLDERSGFSRLDLSRRLRTLRLNVLSPRGSTVRAAGCDSPEPSIECGKRLIVYGAWVRKLRAIAGMPVAPLNEVGDVNEVTNMRDVRDGTQLQLDSSSHAIDLGTEELALAGAFQIVYARGARMPVAYRTRITKLEPVPARAMRSLPRSQRDRLGKSSGVILGTALTGAFELERDNHA